MSTVPQFTYTDNLEYTPLNEITQGVQRLRKNFHEQNNKRSIQFRLNQLRNLYFAIKDNADLITSALMSDFNRSVSETNYIEVTNSLNEIVYAMKHLQDWVKPEPVTEVPASVTTKLVYIERIPMGMVLIISPFNYPLILSVGGILGNIASGNVIVFKPSELTPRYTQVLTKILQDSMDPDTFFIVNGGIPETTALLDHKFDKIMYTGNIPVGTIIAKKAAETLTPVLLELGGKSPAFVLDDVKDEDLPAIARRIVFGKFLNGGQTCIAVDYVLCHDSVKPKLIEQIKKIMNEEFYKHLNKDHNEFTHIIHDRAYNSLCDVIDSTKGDILIDGERDPTTRFIFPTLIDNVTWEDSTMKREIFGPILPILSYNNLSDALIDAVKNSDCPLTQYIFTSGSASRSENSQIDQILTSLRSGSVTINDVIMYISLPNAPFGGINGSGQGAYHGWYSFREFTHERVVVEQTFQSEPFLSMRYPNINPENANVKKVEFLPLHDKVWFEKDGDVTPFAKE